MSIGPALAGIVGALVLLGGALATMTAVVGPIDPGGLLLMADAGSIGAPGYTLATAVPVGSVAIIEVLDDGERLHVFEVQVVAPMVNETDGAGLVLARARLQVRYLDGPQPGSVSLLTFRGTLANGTVMHPHDHYCGAIDDPLAIEARLARGDVVEGDICWRLPQGQAAELRLAVESGAQDVRHLALS